MADIDSEARDAFDDIRGRAETLVGLYEGRDAMFEALRQMFHMEWQERPAGDWIKETMSPTAYNATIGAARLLTATEPQFSVPYDEALPDAREVSEDLEKAARAMWAGSGRVVGRPVHYDLVLSGLLFSEICASVTKTADLVDLAKESGIEANVTRMEAAARRTPYVFRVHDPRGSYPEFDGLGLRGLLRRHKTTWGSVEADWGRAAEEALGGARGEGAVRAQKRLEEVVVNDWYDWQYRAVWLEEVDEPIYFEPHGLTFMPVIAQITEGSNLFSEPNLARFPFLYSVWKSGMWNRENLMLTVIYSMIHQIGSYPLLVHEGAEGEPLPIDRSAPSGMIDLPAGHKLYPLIEKVVDPTQWQGLDVARRYNEQSTIPATTLGAQPQHALAYSAISLLAQSGRLPLLATKELGGTTIADLVVSALLWMKKDGSAKQTLYRKGKKLELDPASIPADIPLECTLEPDLPQDKVQLADAADRLVKATLASRRWARENLLGIGQSDAMDRELYMEQMVEVVMGRVLQELATPPVQPGGGMSVDPATGGAGGGGAGSGGAEGQAGPIENGAFPVGGVRPGAPLQGPLPGPLEQQAGQEPPQQ